MATRIDNVKLTKVVDGDTVKVEIEGQQESLRPICTDTEESRPGNKPVTNAGKEASRLAKQYFGCNEKGFPQSDVRVDIEFDTSDPRHVCLQRHRGNYGRLLCYVHKDGENYNLKAVRDGWSPYFVKYGRSRLYHEDFMVAEADAQSATRMIWDPQTNARGANRDYGALIPCGTYGTA
ncbi:thermonuclease family protein [Candidatus Thiosymbion oneisti]|uniref:thermonuclease family protein n=1 Tax=Candidatus Thiosymbion oneisti TaxID=589554 RepID=UPI001C403E3C|nr:thermonuclease family protein [Candidatus Thiosymbion oneisti]